MRFKLEYIDMDFKPPPTLRFNSFYNFTRDKLFILKDKDIYQDKDISSFSNSSRTSHPNASLHDPPYEKNINHQKAKHVPT